MGTMFRVYVQAPTWMWLVGLVIIALLVHDHHHQVSGWFYQLSVLLK